MSALVDPLDVLPSGDVADLGGLYRAARAGAPVTRLGLDELAAFPGAADFDIAGQLGGRDHAYACFRRDDVWRVLRETESFSSGSFQYFGDVMGRNLSCTDGEEHQRLRALVSYAFRAPSLERWRTEFIEPLAHRLIDGFVGDGRAELNHQFAMELPVQVIARILGLPSGDYERFRSLAFALVLLGVDHNGAVEAARELKVDIARMLDERRASPGDDLISDLAVAEEDGQRLEHDEILDVVVQLVVAGNETTFRGLGTVICALLTHPDELALVQADHSLIPRAIEEALRWEPPLPFDVRTAIRPTALGPYELEPGDLVMLCLGSANRDEDYYEDGDRFWVMRPTPRPHLTFAAGPHVCLGTHLARMELEVSVRALLERLERPRLNSSEPTPVVRGGLVRGPSSLPIVFEPGLRR